MPTIVLDLLKYVFLAVLYIFMARSVRAVYRDMKPAPAGAPAPRAKAAARPSSRRTKKAPTKASVVEGEEMKGKSFDLSDELLIGRGDKCNVKLEDAYVSTVHARIFNRGDSLMVEDMGSTNGTYLNRQKVTSPTELFRGDRVKIGKTVLEMRR
jgi:pSer/pThr/pTyr-binding forkhead associated (FHA) protein